MRTALVALLIAGAVGWGAAAWSTFGDAPWEDAKTVTVVEEVEVEVPVDYRCELAIQTLADAQVAFATEAGRNRLMSRLIDDTEAEAARVCGR